MRRWATWAGLAGLLVFQAWAYAERLPLSLGPRVVLQPWLLRGGFIPYENIVDQHTPLMPILMAVLGRILPDGLQAAALVLVALLSITALLAFAAGRRTAGRVGGLLAAFFFVAWSPYFIFTKLWHETFLAPLYLVFLLAYDPLAARRPAWQWLLLGVLGGCAVLIKQHAAVVVAAFALWNAFTAWRARRPPAEIARAGGLLALGAVLPVLGYAGYQLARAGSLHSFAYWTIVFNATGGYRELAAKALSVDRLQRLAPAGLMLPAAVVALVDARRRGDPAWLGLGWGLVLLVAASLTAYPRFEYFHLQPALPVLAWLSAVPLATAVRPSWPDRGLASGMVVAVLVLWLAMGYSIYQPSLKAGQERPIREYSDLVPLAAEIRQYVAPGDGIYVFPDDEASANLYYLLQTPPPRFWLFTYPWYLQDWVNQEIVATLKRERPAWIVNAPGRWAADQYGAEVVRYIDGHYRRHARLHWAQDELWLLKRVPQTAQSRSSGCRP